MLKLCEQTQTDVAVSPTSLSSVFDEVDLSQILQREIKGYELTKVDGDIYNDDFVLKFDDEATGFVRERLNEEWARIILLKTNAVFKDEEVRVLQSFLENDFDMRSIHSRFEEAWEFERALPEGSLTKCMGCDDAANCEWVLNGVRWFFCLECRQS